MPDDRTTQEPATQMVKEAIDEARVLAKLEVALAKNELKQEVAELKHAAIAFGAAGVSAILMLMMICLAVVLAIGGQWWVAFIGAGIFLLVGIVMGLVGFSVLPKQPLERTRRRLTTDLNQLKERVA